MGARLQDRGRLEVQVWEVAKLMGCSPREVKPKVV